MYMIVKVFRRNDWIFSKKFFRKKKVFSWRKWNKISKKVFPGESQKFYSKKFFLDKKEYFSQKVLDTTKKV